jgi:membrane-bound inhibitor of C-type lysozyme
MNKYLPAACLALGACVMHPTKATERAYLCDGGRLAAVSFSGGVARVKLANDEFELRREAAASGERYSGPRGVLHTKEDEALLTVDGRQLGPCQQVKPKA